MTINTKRGEIFKLNASDPVGLFAVVCTAVGYITITRAVVDKVVQLLNRKKQKETK